VSAGTRRGDTVHVSLVAVSVSWYPEQDDGCALQVLAFKEETGEPSIPGPMIRVRSGTVVHVTVRNGAGRTLWVRGFNDHPSEVREGVRLPDSAPHEFQFRATTPGTYAYGATLAPFPAGGASVRPARDDSQLLGAFIVDSATASDSPRDRVLVITRWTLRNASDSAPPTPPLPPPIHYVNAVNGKSWPHLAPLEYAEGDSIHWRVINASLAAHPMHLHGFYFRVDAKGTLSGDTVLVEPRVMVTEPMTPGQTMQMSWRADRPGNWLFHCHLIAHMRTVQRLDHMSDSASTLLLTGSFVSAVPGPPASDDTNHNGHERVGNHATEGMSGLIVGVQVRPMARAASTRAPRSDVRRAVRLFANQRASVYEGGASAYSFVLQEGKRQPARDSLVIPSSLIVLRRGEPVQITVFNRIPVPISVHWHGLEVESYFDGVGDWSGSQSIVAPPIAPGDSFVVRMTPRRAGTFMYHVHGEEGSELAAGLYGPLVVAEGRTSIDTLTDKIILISDAGPQRDSGVFVNGRRAPRLSLTAGRPHRLRLITITGNAVRNVSLLDGADTVTWRLLARDGADVPPQPLRAASWLAVPGTAVDYEFTPARSSALTLRVITGPFARLRDSIVVPIEVRSDHSRRTAGRRE
jgi:FtsP/CotA-like multicopper oxidase with cupredoxin domain